MTGLLRAEVRRLTSRRLARYVAIAVFAITILTLGRIFLTSARDIDPRLQQIAAQQAEQDRIFCEEAKQRGEIDDAADCATPIGAYFDDPRLHARTALPGGVKTVAVVVGVLALVLGASYVGADWHIGTMQALLFWEPRRGRVMAAKAVALLGVVAAFSVVFHLVVYTGLYLIGATRGTTDGVTGGLHLSNLLTAGRGLVFGAVMALVGYAIAGLARNTVAALVAAFVYVVAVENAVRGLRPGWQRYLLTENTVALLNKRMDVAPASAKQLVDFSGEQAQYVLTSGRAALTLALYVGLLVGAFYLSFTRRDVT